MTFSKLLRWTQTSKRFSNALEKRKAGNENPAPRHSPFPHIVILAPIDLRGLLGAEWIQRNGKNGVPVVRDAKEIMSNVNLELLLDNRLLSIENGSHDFCLTRDEAMDLLERLPSVIAQMPVSQEKETEMKITQQQLESILVNEGIVQAGAIEDPDGYDGGKTELAMTLVTQQINELIKRIPEDAK
jgi:hypothetical protein